MRCILVYSCEAFHKVMHKFVEHVEGTTTMTLAKSEKPYTEVVLAADFLRDIGLAPTTAVSAAMRLMEIGFKRHEIYGFDTGKRVFLYLDARAADTHKQEFLDDYAPKTLLGGA